MISRAISVTEANRHFSEYINRIVYKHERFILLKGKKAVAELKPLPMGRILSELPGLISTLPKLAEEEITSFTKDIIDNRKKSEHEEMKDPWVS